MKLSDFSNGFDVLMNSYAGAAAFGSTDNPGGIELTEHEKSQFLTLAQEQVVLSLYTGRNSSLKGFEETEEVRRYLSPLICEEELNPVTNLSDKPIGLDKEKKTRFFTLPDGSVEGKPAVWFITYESVTLDSDDRPCAGIGSLQVTPVRQDEYHRIRKNPFRGSNNRRALRLDLPDNMVEIISQYTITKYYVRYLRKLKPIILAQLDEEAAIEGEVSPTECELDDSLHQRILERAVQMALQSRGYTQNNNENR